MKIDMSSQAITKRLRQTSELRRLCLALEKNSFNYKKSNNKLTKKVTKLDFVKHGL